MDAPLDRTATTISNNSNISAATTVFASFELTEEEERDRLHLERQVERAFYAAGKALRELRDRKLYRNSHKTFEEYCKDRFSYNRSRSYQLIDAAGVVDNLQKCPQIVEVLPTAEGQVRPLAKLEAEEQVDCWQQAVEAAGGKVPSGQIVNSIVDKLREKMNLPNPYRLGEVCQILPKENPELAGKSGRWAIITDVGNFSCRITTWDGEYIAKIDNLKCLNFSAADCEYMQQLCQRLVRLHQAAGGRDPAVGWLLSGLGKQNQPFLTPLQEKLLLVAEQEYGLDLFCQTKDEKIIP